MKVCGMLVPPPRMVPGPKIAAVERREARHPISGMSHDAPMSFASSSSQRDK